MNSASIKGLLIFIITIILIALETFQFSRLPTVYHSKTLNECIYVKDYKGNKIDNGCAKLPRRYLGPKHVR